MIHPLSRYYPDDLSFVEVDKLVFKGLPASFAGFGNKTLTLSVAGNVSHRAKIQTFFTSTATNHPTYPTNQVPNWYYYYNQVHTSPGSYTASGNSTTLNIPPNFPILIGYGAYQPQEFPMFRLSAPYIEFEGWLGIAGIHTFVAHCEHESGHRFYMSSGVDVPNRPPADDRDGDDLSNEWEEAHYLNPDDNNTTDAFEQYRDFQLIADVYMWSHLKSEKGLFSK